MNGRILFIFVIAGILPFLFVDPVFADKTKKCSYFRIVAGNDNYLTHSQVESTVYDDIIINLSSGTVSYSGSHVSTAERVSVYFVEIMKYIDGNWKLVLNKSYCVKKGWKPNSYDNFEPGLVYTSFQIFASRYKDGCLDSSCSDIDSDGDGICDQCDTRPGEPDPDDCIVFSTVNSADVTTSWTVSPGCTGDPDEYEFYASPSHSQSDYVDLPQTSTPIAPKNCHPNASGECDCLHAPASDGPGSLTPNPGDTGGGDTGGGDTGGGDTGGGDTGGGDTGGGDTGGGDTGGGDTGGGDTGGGDTGGGGSGGSGGDSGGGSGSGSGDGDGEGNGNLRFEGTADYPAGVTYDSDVDNSGLEEKSLAESITQYVHDGLPVVSHFTDTRLRVVGSNPVLRAEIFGRTVIIDFTTIDDFLRMAGLVLVFICTVIAFMIIVRRG